MSQRFFRESVSDHDSPHLGEELQQQRRREAIHERRYQHDPCDQRFVFSQHKHDRDGHDGREGDVVDRDGDQSRLVEGGDDVSCGNREKHSKQ